MNTKIPMAATAMLLVGMATASAVRAFDVAETLGTSENAVDVFTITCPTGTAATGARNAKAWVSDVNPPNNTAKMGVFLFKSGYPISQPSEDIAPAGAGGEGGGSSAETSRGDGAGTYQVQFYKTASGDETYTGKIQCLNSAVPAVPVGVSAPVLRPPDQ